MHPAGHSANVEVHRGSQGRIPISFLLNCPHDFHRLLAGQHEGLFEPRSPSGPFTEAWPFLLHAFVYPSALDVLPHYPSPLSGLGDYPGLSETSKEFFPCLNQAPIPFPQKANSYRTRAPAFVSEANIMRFVEHSLPVHIRRQSFYPQGLFNADSASRYLVLAIVLFGLPYAFAEDTSAHNEWYDVVEYLIFEGHEFQQLPRQREHPIPTTAIIQLVQAASLLFEL